MAVALCDREYDEYACSVPMEEAKANAHLIAAAPDLYEALTRWRSVLTEWESVRIQATDIGADMAVSQLMMDTDAALAKARGETDG